MSAGHHIGMPFVSWEGIAALLTALGLGGALTAWAQRPSRRAVDATAANAHATGEAAVIAATATAFTEVTSGLREEIERLQQVAVRFEADLAAAHDRTVTFEAQVKQMQADLDRVRAERDAAIEKTVQQEGEIRQLKAVIDAHARAAS